MHAHCYCEYFNIFWEFFLAPQLSSCAWESENGHTLRHKNDTMQSSTPYIRIAVLILHAVYYGKNILKF